jgi:hypothetical protein
MGNIISRMVGQDSVVRNAACYGLDGPVIESRLGRDFPHPSRPNMGPPSRMALTEVKRRGRGVDHPLPSRKRG